MFFTLTRSRRKLLTTLLVGVAAALFVHSGIDRISALHSLEERLENVFYDLNWQIAFLLDKEEEAEEGSAAVQAVEDRIVVIDIDESSLDELGPYHQWPRSHHARVVELLSQGGAAAILFDILFSTADFGARDAERAQQAMAQFWGADRAAEFWPLLKQAYNADSQFVETIKQSGRVIAGATANHPDAYYQSQWKRYSTAEWFAQNSPQSALSSDWAPKQFRWELLDNIFPELSQAAERVGLVNVVADFDGVHRREPLLHALPYPPTKESGPTMLYPVVSLQAVMWLMGVEPNQLTIRPGEELLLPPPVRLSLAEDGLWSASTPMVTPPMVGSLLQKSEQLAELLQLKERYPGRLTVASQVVVQRDSSGEYQADIADAEQLNNLMILWAIDEPRSPELWDRVAQERESLELTEGLELRWSDDEEAVVLYDSDEDEEVPLPRYTLEVLSWGKEQLQQLAPGGVLHLSSTLNFYWLHRENELYSNFILFSEPVVRDLIAFAQSDLSKQKTGTVVALGDSLRIPVDRNENMMIRFRGPGTTPFRSLSYSKLLKGEVDPGGLQGKIFVLGSTASALFDIVSAPGDRAYPGIMIHANLLDNLLRGSFLKEVSPQTLFPILLLLAIAIAFLSNYSRPVLAVVVMGAVAIAWFGINFKLFIDHFTYFGIVKPLFAVGLSFTTTFVLRYLFEEREKRHAVDAFKSYISPELIDQMLESETQPTLGGEKQEITAYFTDIQGFSTFSEKIGDAGLLVQLINEYLTAMTDTLMAQGGTLDKYIGDAIVAFFGAPMPLPNHARSACLTALAMQQKLAELRDKWKSEGEKWPEIVHQMQMRIGINSGEIVTGNMGSSMRMNYTMMGDDVNLAARLESGAKQYGVYIVVSKASLARAGEGLLARRLDLVRVVGKSEPVEIYELLATEENKSPEHTQLLQLWNRAVAHYNATEWESAEALFMQTLSLEPNHPDKVPWSSSTPSHLYIERCRHYRQHPPVPAGEKWDGIYTATSK